MLQEPSPYRVVVVVIVVVKLVAIYILYQSMPSVHNTRVSTDVLLRVETPIYVTYSKYGDAINHTSSEDKGT